MDLSGVENEVRCPPRDRIVLLERHMGEGVRGESRLVIELSCWNSHAYSVKA